MKKNSSIAITCSECGKKIKITADDAVIRWQFNGGCPGCSVKIECPHCKKMSTVKQTLKTKRMLANRINSIVPMSYR